MKLRNVRSLRKGKKKTSRRNVFLATKGQRQKKLELSQSYNNESSKDFEILKKKFGYSTSFSFNARQEIAAIDADCSQIFQNIKLEKSFAQRVDFSKDCVFTIDDVAAKDFDDAISLSKNKLGYLLGVHIADVSYFVKENSFLQKEALERGTSVYCVENVLPMLPDVLSNKWCSLLPREYRLTFSCIIQFDRNGEVANYSFQKSIIKSKQKISYQQAESSLNKKEIIGSQIDEKLVEMLDLSNMLREKRINEGAIDFDFPVQEWSIVRGSEKFSKETIGVGLRSRLRSETIIEEFMLATNKLAAKELLRTGKGIFRIHGVPNEQKKIGLFKFLKDNNIILPKAGSDNPLFQKGKNKLQLLLMQLKNDEYKEVVSGEILKSMDKARYSCKNTGHYGLGFTCYTHFTSPIRRYPDLMVHYLLTGITRYRAEPNKKLLKRDAKFLQLKNLREAANVASFKERKAIDAEREYKKIKAIRFLENQPLVETYKAIVIGFSFSGNCFVRLLETGIEGQLQFKNWHEMYFDSHQKVLLQDGSTAVFMGMKVKVKIKGLIANELKINFQLVDS